MDLVAFWNTTTDGVCVLCTTRDKDPNRRSSVLSHNELLRRGVDPQRSSALFGTAAGQIGASLGERTKSSAKPVPPFLSLPGASMRCARNIVANLCLVGYPRASSGKASDMIAETRARSC